jgi:hypothetical protein
MKCIGKSVSILAVVATAKPLAHAGERSRSREDLALRIS